MKGYKLLSYKNLNDELTKSWKNLWRKSKYANFFNSYEFFLTCINTFKDDDYEIFWVEKNSEVIAILPLIKKRVFGFISYVNPGGRFVEKSPLLVIENKVSLLKILIDFILKKGNIHLSEVSKGVSQSLQKVYPESLLSIISVNPYIDLKTDPFTHITKEHTNKIKSKIRRNREKIDYFHLKDNLEKALKLVINLEKDSHKKAVGKEIFDSKSSIRFYENLINFCSKYVVFDYLTFKKKPFVTLAGIICKDTYYAYHTSYLREYKNLMPGKLICFYVINELKEEGIKVFDFVRGFSNFKEEFTKNYQIHYDFYFSKNSLINIWWKIINFARRVRIVLLKTENSKDYLYLFKKI